MTSKNLISAEVAKKRSEFWSLIVNSINCALTFPVEVQINDGKEIETYPIKKMLEEQGYKPMFSGVAGSNLLKVCICLPDDKVNVAENK